MPYEIMCRDSNLKKIGSVREITPRYHIKKVRKSFCSDKKYVVLISLKLWKRVENLYKNSLSSLQLEPQNTTAYYTIIHKY